MTTVRAETCHWHDASPRPGPDVSITSAITAHMTPNVMGLPHPGWELRQHPNHKKINTCRIFIRPLTEWHILQRNIAGNIGSLQSLKIS
ncbi:hypothetical protein JB92DRAFT_2938847 [Gautieria morchelliformis]|nr:hypothetical protein JB92DRAFT_2938847 [Gautieria morchelliformis]